MINLKIQDRPVEVPTRWEDVTFRQYEAFINLKENDAFGLIAVFTGIDREVWEQSKEVENFYLIENSLAWLKKKPPMRKAKLPYEITVKDQRIVVPKSQDEYIVKEYEDLRAIMQLEIREKKEIKFEFYPKIAAIFLTRKIFPEYNSNNYEETINLMKDLRLFDVLGIGNFFLMSLIELRSGIRKGWPLWSMIRRKLMQVSGAWRYGGFLTRLTN
jgi:hypothetical protein